MTFLILEVLIIFIAAAVYYFKSIYDKSFDKNQIPEIQKRRKVFGIK
jgi:hypothetical protein